jgi:protein-S-isoprenylcysteine O-methyltransferase Ste14
MVMLSRVWLAVRSLFWTLALPGVFAGYLPWRFFGVRLSVFDPGAPLHWAGLLLVGLGVLLLAACIFEFARSGAGTLAPVDPPRVLVVRGLYRYVRNPMYLSVTMIILGEALVAGSRALLIYWSIWFLAANLFVIAYEEPTLRRRFGRSYELYTQQVRRWLPRITPTIDSHGIESTTPLR